jgi:hypothetical protein
MSFEEKIIGALLIGKTKELLLSFIGIFSLYEDFFVFLY